jgi:hypothetical protein
MKTNELVELLAADRIIAPALGRTLILAMVPAVGIAFLLFLLFAGFRDDLVESLGSTRFDFKVLLNLTLAAVSAGVLLRLGRPGSRSGAWRGLAWAVPAALGLAVLVELSVQPASHWWTVARGENASWCLRMIPLLALAPLLATLWSLRQAAPSRPVLTGAVAGLMSAGIGGALYALHCQDDSPLFVAIWYVIATAIVAAIGALLGSRWLRW